MNMKWVAGLVASAVVLGQAYGGVISINVGGFDANHDVDGTTGAEPAANWNNLTGVANPSSSSLVDDTGAAVTGMSISFSGWNRDTFNAWGDDRADMYSNFLHQQGDTLGNATVTINNIPYAEYDVYIYYNCFPTWQVQKWQESQGGTMLYGLRGASSGGGVSGFVPYQTSDASTAFDDAAAQASGVGGNYLKFTGLTAANLTLTNTSSPDQSGWNQNGIAGLQIVGAIPEPATMGLLGLAAMGILARRRLMAR